MGKDLKSALNSTGLSYTSKYIKPGVRIKYEEGTIVLLRRSRLYPVGHYLIRHNNLWMDPWIYMPKSKNIRCAKSGYRKRLPGIPMYVLVLNNSEPYTTTA